MNLFGTMDRDHCWNREISDVDTARIIAETKAALKQAGPKKEPKAIDAFSP
jgi:hypothetical protein